MSTLSRHSHWVLILVCWIMYGLAFTYPAIAKDNYPRLVTDFSFAFPEITGDRSEPFSKTTLQDFSGLSGRDAFTIKWLFRDEVWFANPALWLATIFLAWRVWSCATVVGFVGLCFSTQPLSPFFGTLPDYTYGTGYWLWMASLGVLFAGSLAGWCGLVSRDRRRSPAELFSGWRGLTLGSWLAAAVVVFVAWWERYRDLHPPFFWRAMVITVWVCLGVMALAGEWFRDERCRTWGWPMLAAWNWIVFALLALAIWYFWLDIYPPKPPR